MGRVRKAVPGDLPRVNALLEEVLRVHHAGRPDLFNAGGKKYSDEELLTIFADPLTPVFVYEEDGVVLGYAFCVIREPGAASGSLRPVKTLYIDDICVDPQARGKHIGTTLFEHVRGFARSLRCHNITLHVWACNPSARAFYDSLGLQPQYTSMEIIL